MSTAIPTPAPGDDKSVERVVLVSYPKIVFLWPSFLAALIAALKEQPDAAQTLVKGSRFMKMEQVVAALQNNAGGPHAA